MAGFPIRVLCVEDDPADVELELRELRKAWFDVQGDIVERPDELIQRVRDKTYDVVLTDYRLEGWTGLDALGLLRQRHLDMPVILVTGALGEEPAVECLKRGISDYVLKDRLGRLPLVVRRALEEQSLREAQRRAEEALRRSEASKRSLIEGASFGIGRSCVAEDRLLEANPAMVRMLGYDSEAELLRLSLRRDVYADPERRAQVLELSRTGDVVQNEELELKRKDGRHIIVRANLRTVRDASAAPRELEFILEDITEQRRAEQELDQFFRLSHDLLCILGFDGTLRRLNPAWERTLGLTAEELRSRRLMDFVHPEDRAGIEAELMRLAGGQNSTLLTFRVRAQDGSYRWLVTNATPSLSRQVIYSVARDVTERRQAEEALARLAAVVDASEDAIIAEEPDGTIVNWNSGAERMYGYAAPEMIGRPVVALCPEDRLAELAGLLETVRRGESVRSHETGRLAKDGRRIDVSLTLSPVRGADGNIRWISSVAHDISGRKALEEQLKRRNQALREQNRKVQEASRMKTEFLANMSHELRSPLNCIIGFAEMLHDGKLGAVSLEHREYLRDILSSARHLLRLIEDVLDLSRVESGRMDFRREVVSLPQLVAEVAEVLRAVAVEKHVAVELDLSAEVEQVMLDPGRLKQVLYNYLSNALKFTPEEGRVIVRTRPEEGAEFRLEVEDNGIGIRPEQLPELFLEFRQLDTGAAKKYPGSGLGLALTKHIVEAQGGRVEVRSQPGLGSVFAAVLPRLAPPETSVAAPSILVIEDERRDRLWTADILRQAGFSIELAATTAEALALCDSRRFSCITLDLLLPDSNGWEVLSAIRESPLNAGTPVIVLSMVTEKGAGAVFPIQGFLTKPVEAQELLEALARAGVRPESDRRIAATA